MIKGLIFDLDGTLLDTVEDIKNSLNHTLKAYNFKTLTTQEVKNNLGNGAKALVKKSIQENITEETLEKVVSFYSNYYQLNNQKYTKPYLGILPLLKTLKETGYQLAIVSNKDQKGVDTLNKQAFLGLIDVALGENPGIPLKPHPQAVFSALEKMGLKKEEVLYIGDTEVDLKTAENAGVKSIGVTWGFREKEVLKDLNPDYLIDKPEDILKILK